MSSEEIAVWRSSDEWEHELGVQLRTQRLRMNMSQAEAANRTGLSLGAITRLEKGGGSSLSSFIKYAQLLGKDDWLASFAPQVSVSPIQQLELGHQRQRASKRKGTQ